MRVNAALPSLPELQQEEHHHAAFQLTSTADDAACLELKAVVADCFKVNNIFVIFENRNCCITQCC